VGARKPKNGGRETARRKPSAIRKRKPEEAQSILERILERHPELRIEAETSAHDPGGEESVEWTAESISNDLLALDVEDLYSRAGSDRWGHVDPVDARGGAEPW
jgi:hypothetical protein